MRRPDRAGAQHDPVSFDLEYFSAAFGFDADGPAVLDQDLANKDMASHRQVQIMPHRIEMPHSGAHPDAVYVIRRCQAEACGVQAILVVGGAEPRLQAGRMERLLDRRDGPCLTTPDRDRPIRTVAIIVLNVEIALRFAKVRHDLFVGPFVIAESRPGVEILGESPLHRLAVDRRPAADHLALCDVDFALLLGDGPPQGPVVQRVRSFGKAGVAEFDVVREMSRIGVIRAGFQQQHRSSRVCRQPAGQH